MVSPMPNMEFDYIIVGAGSAGCVVASRLSEDPSYSVLLVEAGGRDNHPLYHMPAGFAKMTKGIGSWGWDTVPQRHVNDKIFRYTQAKVMGGGSTINAQIYTRGARQDYDEWRQMGCVGWSYDDVLPYYKKAENNDSFNDAFHAKDGPLSVSQPSAPLPICDAFFDAAAELGIPRTYDVNGAKQDGVGYYQLTQKNARRCSSAKAYLDDAKARKNLKIMTNRQVKQLHVNEGRAVSIEFDGGLIVSAKVEIILSCGAVGTPRLLQLSGIGDPAVLKDAGIKIVTESPEVGKNFQDHLDLYCIAELSGHYSYDRYANPFYAAMALMRFIITRSGPVASSLFETGGFWYADSAARSPDLQMHLGLGTGIEHGVAAMPNGGITLNSCYLRPRSRGSVLLKDADPNTPPLINPNYLADDHDRAMSIVGLKLTQSILGAQALKPYIKQEQLPGPDVVTDDDYLNYIGQHSKTSHHSAGTARMGADPLSVVDNRLKFRGIRSLRIVDNSIMPQVISSNTNAAAIMIGEKASDMIKDDQR